MNTLQRPEVAALLDELFRAAERTDGPWMARLHALDPAARAALFHDYAHLYGELAEEAYLPISRDGGRLLYALARARDAATIVEFGTSFGLSTLHLAAAIADRGGGRVITTELSPAKAERAREHLRRAGLAPYVEIRVGDALETLVDLPSVDLVYLDGAKQLYGRILAQVEPSLSDRAVVVADNVDMGDLVRDFLAHVRAPDGGYASHRVEVAGEGIEIAIRTSPGVRPAADTRR